MRNLNHDESTCHACAVIKLRHASGGTLDPNATLDPSARVRSSFPRIPEEMHRRFKAIVNSTILDQDIEKALRQAQPLSAPVRLSPLEDEDRGALLTAPRIADALGLQK